MRYLARFGLVCLVPALAVPNVSHAQFPTNRAKAAVVHSHPGTAGMSSNMPGTIVGCAHSANGVCAQCKYLLSLPGGQVVSGPGAVAPEMSAPAESAPAYVATEPGGPQPLDVMQTNFSRFGARPAEPVPSMAAARLGIVDPLPSSSNPYSNPFMPTTRVSKRPSIIGHMLGLSGRGREWSESREFHKKEAHASIPYGPNMPKKVEELPARMVFGRAGHNH